MSGIFSGRAEWRYRLSILTVVGRLQLAFNLFDMSCILSLSHCSFLTVKPHPMTPDIFIADTDAEIQIADHYFQHLALQ